MKTKKIRTRGRKCYNSGKDKQLQQLSFALDNEHVLMIQMEQRRSRVKNIRVCALKTVLYSLGDSLVVTRMVYSGINITCWMPLPITCRTNGIQLPGAGCTSSIVICHLHKGLSVGAKIHICRSKTLNGNLFTKFSWEPTLLTALFWVSVGYQDQWSTSPGLTAVLHCIKRKARKTWTIPEWAEDEIVVTKMSVTHRTA